MTAVSAAISLLCTYLISRLAGRYGWVAQPRKDRWHEKPVALFGGVGIALAFFLSLLPFLHLFNQQALGVLLGGFVMFLTGLLDDIFDLRASLKFGIQIVAAIMLIYMGITILKITSPWISIPMSILWLVGVTNAFNLLDNMDGLAAGVAAIAGSFLLVISILHNNGPVALISCSFVGACIGFLRLNVNPAKIFMGDSGSLLLGFILASASLVGTWHHATNIASILFAPVALFAIPILDTTLVTTVRILQGRRIAEGGRDHTSHRLVALGSTEKNAVRILWGLTFLCGSLGLAGQFVSVFVVIIMFFFCGLLLLAFGIFLALHQSSNKFPLWPNYYTRPKTKIGQFLWAKQRTIGCFLIDTLLVGLGLTCAYLLRFEDELEHLEAQLSYILPLSIGIKMACFIYRRTDRILWRYISLKDSILIAKTSLEGSVILILVLLMATRFESLSRAVFAIDFLLTTIFICTPRIFFRSLREYLENPQQFKPKGRRVVILGAGDRGELAALNLLRTKGDIRYTVVGFLDDDPKKYRSKLRDIPVLGSCDLLMQMVEGQDIEEVVIALPTAELQEKYSQTCKDALISYSLAGG